MNCSKIAVVAYVIDIQFSIKNSNQLICLAFLNKSKNRALDRCVYPHTHTHTSLICLDVHH